MDNTYLLLMCLTVIILCALTYLVTKQKLKGFSIKHKDTELKVEGFDRNEANNESEVYGKVRRFKRVLLAHEIPINYWADFFEVCKAPFTIENTDLTDEDTLLHWLNKEKTDWLCQLFLIDRDWINSDTRSPHAHYNFCQRPKRFAAVYDDESRGYPLDDMHSHRDAVFLLNTQSKRALEESSTRISMAYGIPVCQLGNEILVTRWIVDDTAGGYPWLSRKYQPFIRAFARIAHRGYGMYTTWEPLKPKDFEAFQNGDLLLPEALKRSRRVLPNNQPEDYGLTKQESAVAKATNTLQPILDYLEKENLPGATEEPLPALTLKADA